MTQQILDQRAAAVIEANKYLTLGTVDADGLPWVTPVYFTPDGHADFYWASSPEALHSKNIATTPDVSIAIFDSSVRIGGASAVYFRARASLVPDEELEACATLYTSRCRPADPKRTCWCRTRLVSRSPFARPTVCRC